MLDSGGKCALYDGNDGSITGTSVVWMSIIYDSGTLKGFTVYGNTRGFNVSPSIFNVIRM